MNFEEIIAGIESSLKNQGTFGYVLKSNPNIYINRIQSIHYDNYWFEYEETGLRFIGEPIIYELAHRGSTFYHYISDFIFIGKLCYSENNKEYNVDFEQKATISVYKQSNFEIDVTRNSNHVEIWDLDQKIIKLIQIRAKKKLESFSMIPYDFGYYTKAWPKINRTSINYGKQKHVTSYYYLQELVECYERIKHLLSIVLINDLYANNYTSYKTALPRNYHQPYIYDISDNFKTYDRFFLMYSELTIESLYKYWERVAFYLFQFFKPVGKKLNDNNLSLHRLISELNKEYSVNSQLNNNNFDWFVDFVLNPNSDFEKLKSYRHPLVHYKVNISTGQEIGSIISAVLNSWGKDPTNKMHLEELERNNKKLKDFLLFQFDLCKLGYDHMLGMISVLPDHK